MKSNWAIIVLAIVVIVVLIFAYANYRAGLIIYNNGVCLSCGGHFHIVGTPTKNHHYYTYECNQCGDGFTTVVMMHKSK